MVATLPHGARRTFSQVACSLVAILVVVNIAQSAQPEFRIETKIYQGEEKEPVSKATTLFREGVVYDFLDQPEQAAVFRKANGDHPARFILINDQNQIQTEISTEKLATTMSKLRNWAAEQRNPFLQFSANPRFNEKYDSDSGKLVLESQLMTYTVETYPTGHQEALASYHEFLNWYAQLNTLLTAGNPPDPRLKLNAALARRKVFPAKVELKRGGEDPIRAEHDFVWRLSQDDLSRIEDVHNAMTAYRQVDNREFLKLSEPVVVSK
jgi:hypothetical protein